MAGYGVKTVSFALNDAGNFHEFILKTWGLLLDNIHLLFSMNLNHVLFTNAGALFIMMLIPWRNRRDVVFKILAVVFIIGQFLCGIIIEFRIWYEILPLGWMVISEALSSRCPIIMGGQSGPGQGQPDPVADDRTSRVLKGSYWLMIGALLVLALGICALSDNEPALAGNRSQNSAVEVSTNGLANKLSGDSEFQASMELAGQLEKAGKFEQAIQQYREAVRLNPNDASALNNLAWALAANPRPELRDGREAVRLANKAVVLSDHQQPIFMGTLAAAYAEDGQFSKAVEMAEKARDLALMKDQKDVAAKNEQLLKLYSAGKAVGTTNVP